MGLGGIKLVCPGLHQDPDEGYGHLSHVSLHWGQLPVPPPGPALPLGSEPALLGPVKGLLSVALRH